MLVEDGKSGFIPGGVMRIGGYHCSGILQQGRELNLTCLGKCELIAKEQAGGQRQKITKRKYKQQGWVG